MTALLNLENIPGEEIIGLSTEDLEGWAYDMRLKLCTIS